MAISVYQQQQRQRRERLAGAAGLVACAVALGAALVMFADPLPLAVGVGVLACVGTILVRPRIGVYLLLFCALFLEQWGIVGLDPVSARFPFYRTLSGTGTLAVPVSPVEMLLLLTLASLVMRVLFQGRATMREQIADLQARGGIFVRGPLFAPVLLFLVFVVASLGFGLTGWGGTGPFDIRAAWEETRSFFYMGIAYVLVCNLVRTRAQVHTMIWLFIAAIGLKSVQGVVRYADMRARGLWLDAITGHEDVVFFAAFVLLLGGLILFGERKEAVERRQMIAMLVLLPPLIFTLVATNRRLGFVVLLVALGLVGLLLLRTYPGLFLRVAPPVLVLFAVYTALFWNGTGTLSQPLVALRSLVAPTTERDRNSNAWREIENWNIEYNLRSAPVTGLGFGRPYTFALPQPPLDQTGFTYWRYITHNAIFWVWMKMGLAGFVLFWYLMGSATVLGLVAFRQLRDGYLRTVALTAAGVVIMQVIFSYGDLGLTYSRSMIFLGCMLGVLAVISTEYRVPSTESPVSATRYSVLGTRYSEGQ
jgi:hypothetical protein